MNYNNPIPATLANIIKALCALLFAAFAFLYIYQIQGYVLAEAQYVFSDGVTTYSLPGGAIIITILLLCLQQAVARFTHISGRWYALTYAPSFVVLAMLTSLHRQTILEFGFGQWMWVVPLFIVLYVMFVRTARRWLTDSISSGDYSLGRYLWTNFLTLLLMMLACGANAPAKDVYLYELKAEQCLLNKDYEGASRVGQRSLQTSPRLNQLRLFALAKQGLLADNLFDYPQPYADTSLILLNDTVSHESRFTALNIQDALGARANHSVSSVGQYLELLRKNPHTSTNPLLPDYLLCHKLLSADLRGFNHTIRHYYDVSNAEDVMKLPRAYREALLLQARAISRDSLNSFADTLMLAHYRQYQEIQADETDSLHRANRLHRLFGNTLWWYLDYGVNTF